MIERDNPHPAHPLVNWNVTKVRRQGRAGRERDRVYVLVECPRCHIQRFCESAKVAQQIRWGQFSGHCLAHRRGLHRTATPEPLTLSQG